MEINELYIAPEVELICFRPVENLAAEASFWSVYGEGVGDRNQGDFNSPGTGDTDEDLVGEPDLP